MSTLTDMIRGRQTVINLTNQAGVTANYGDVVVVDTGHTESFILTSTAQSSNATGVVLDTSIAAAAQGRIIVAGYAPQVNLAAYASNGYFLETSTTLHLGNGNPQRRIGSFGQLLSMGSNPSVELWQSPDNATPGSPLTNPMTTTGDVIVGGTSGTPARLGVGTNGQVLTANSGATNGVDWEVPPLPWLYHILPGSPASAADTGTWALAKFSTEAYTYMHNSLLENTSGAQNDARTWAQMLAAGTWTVQMAGKAFSTAAIVTVKIDGSSVGTMDFYNSSDAYRTSTITGVSIATTAKHTIQIIAATKNGSSGGYYVLMDLLSLIRTA